MSPQSNVCTVWLEAILKFVPFSTVSKTHYFKSVQHMGLKFGKLCHACFNRDGEVTLFCAQEAKCQQWNHTAIPQKLRVEISLSCVPNMEALRAVAARMINCQHLHGCLILIEPICVGRISDSNEKFCGKKQRRFVYNHKTIKCINKVKNNPVLSFGVSKQIPTWWLGKEGWESFTCRLARSISHNYATAVIQKPHFA